MRQPLEDAYRPPLRTLLWLLVATAATLSLATAESICSSCSIYILDLSSFANGADFPVCELDKVVTVNPDNGVVYLEDTKIARKVSHKFGTHSAPWYLYKASRCTACASCLSLHWPGLTGGFALCRQFRTATASPTTSRRPAWSLCTITATTSGGWRMCTPSAETGETRQAITSSRFATPQRKAHQTMGVHDR